MRQLAAELVDIAKLLRAYLTALDAHFKTIDFLTLLNLGALHPLARMRFLG